MDFTRKIDVRAFTLADPYRVVVDIPEVTFQLPAKTGESGRGLIKAFRYGLVMQGGSRIVFDLTKPARVEKAFVVDAADGAPARLVLDLVATDRESFLRRSAVEATAGLPGCRGRRAVRPRTPISVRSSSSIPATVASIPAPKDRTARRKRTSCSISPSGCVSASKRPENTGCS